jgi:hypothetical protein
MHSFDHIHVSLQEQKIYVSHQPERSTPPCVAHAHTRALSSEQDFNTFLSHERTGLCMSPTVYWPCDVLLFKKSDRITPRR